MNKKSYRVSVKYKTGTLAGKFVVQVVNVSYDIACELYDIWTESGFEVLIIQMNCRKPSVNKAINNIQDNELLNYESYGAIELTKEGENLAKKILETYDIVFLFLKDVLGIEHEK